MDARTGRRRRASSRCTPRFLPTPGPENPPTGSAIGRIKPEPIVPFRVRRVQLCMAATWRCVCRVFVRPELGPGSPHTPGLDARGYANQGAFLRWVSRDLLWAEPQARRVPLHQLVTSEHTAASQHLLLLLCSHSSPPPPAYPPFPPPPPLSLLLNAWRCPPRPIYAGSITAPSPSE